MLINLSNHPMDKWDSSQLAAANRYGQIVDLPFPSVDPQATTGEIEKLAESFANKIFELFSSNSKSECAIHIMGELTFCFILVTKLQKAGIICLASTTQRQTIDHPNGSKISVFKFVQFREYPQFESI